MDFSDLGGQAVQDKGIDFSDLGGTPVNPGIVGNAIQDAKDIGGGMINTAKGLVTDPINTIKSMPAVAIDEAKRIGVPEIFNSTFPPAKAVQAILGKNPDQQAVGAGKKFMGAAYDKPISTALDVATFALPESAEAVSGVSKVPKEIGDYMNSKSQMMSLRQMGASPLQVKKLGSTPEQVMQAQRSLGQYGLDTGLVDLKNGPEGMATKHAQMLKDSGAKVGSFREAADKAGPAFGEGELMSLVRQKLDPIYQRGITPENQSARGVQGMDSSAYKKALQEVEDAEQTHSGIANAATTLRGHAQQANKMQLNPGPYTDVAKTISDINNARIAQKIGPKAAAQYEQALKEYGATHKIGNFLKNRVAGETKREGPGSFVNNLFQKGLDEAGYRTIAKGLNKITGGGKNLPNYFKDYIHHLDDEEEIQ